MISSLSPFVMVIFGATGDLTARKLVPALFHLYTQKILPEKFLIIGMARRPFTHDEFRTLVKQAVGPVHQLDTLDQLNQFVENIFYQQGMFEDDRAYEEIVKTLKSFDEKMGACITRFFYLATPPANYATILTKLESSKLSEGCGQGSIKWTRLLIEKPFGKDLETAKMLEEKLSGIFAEKQIYRIDHYLAKETLQNILYFRFANGLFEPMLDKAHIDHVQISLLEGNGIDRRAKFYEGVGALRDTAQNHLMAMLAYIAMEEPQGLGSDAIRSQRVKVLRSIILTPEEKMDETVIRGQYTSAVIDGKEILGYRQEKGVDPASTTETFVSFKLLLSAKRWEGVPFYLRTGKRMSTSQARIDIQFKNPQNSLFKQIQPAGNSLANILSIRVQPREGISLRFYAKKPGLSLALTPVDMDFSYLRSFKKDIDDSYEKLLLDSMLGDQTLFATAAGFKATWEFATPILRHWEKNSDSLKFYPAGTNGSKESDILLAKDGREWTE